MNVHQPTIRIIPVNRLTVDHGVQRPLDPARVDRIVADYQVGALGVLVASKRADGTIHIIDGQHRHAATIAAGYSDQTLQCQVYEGLTLAEEAAMFRRLNNTRAVAAVDKFRVRVVEGDPAALMIDTLLRQHGWTVVSRKTPGSFVAVSAIESVYRGPERGKVGRHLDVVERVIITITKSWGHDSDGVRAEIVSGLGALLHRYGQQVDTAKLVAELSAYPGGPRALIGKARGLRDFRNCTVTDAFGEVLVGLVNKSRRTNRLPDWRNE